MIKELFKKVTSWFSKKEVVKEVRTVVYAPPIQEAPVVLAEVVQMKRRPKDTERMSYAEMKANQAQLDLFYKRQNAQPALRLVA
jgi:hypothetical protein